jgi:signal peptidase I
MLNSFVIQSYQVDGQSMENTLQNDDRLIVNKVPRTLSRLTGHQYVPGRGQIIIFNEAGLPGFVGEKQLIKRVIGLPGEHVVVKDGRITVYNAQHPNGFDPDDAGTYQTASPVTVGDVNVYLQKDEIFVCGDNRPNSEDSRYFGPIKTNQVVAKLVLRILPLNKVHNY